MNDPTPDELIALVRRVEAAGFELFVWLERVELPDRKVKDFREHLGIRAAEGRRRPPDRLAELLMAHARPIRGYLRRVRSAFFPDPASIDDHRLAMLSSLADDFRLRANGR